MDLPITGQWRRARGARRFVSLLVLVSFLGLQLQPLALAAQAPSAPKASSTPAPSDEERLYKALLKIEEKLAKLIAKLAAQQDGSLEEGEVKELHKDLLSLDRRAIQAFDAIEQNLKAKGLPQVILSRHATAVQAYRTDFQTLDAHLTALEAAPTDQDRKLKAEQAKKHLEEKQKKKAHPSFDPNNLPSGPLKPNPGVKPRLTTAQYREAGLYDHPYTQFATLGDFSFGALPGANDPAYLAATTEVTLTPAIQAKAAELNHNPVAIYSWVRNNVEWLPTWGATQDAEVTLGSRRGNSLDIASLTLALLRASGIPARYVHGTIEVPEDRFRNWAGGFASIEAAVNYAATGGIPVTTVTSGGKITKVQLEHVWVEAAVDFYPSRGAINKSTDAWIQLDPGYKQYEDLPGLDVIQISGINPNALAQSFATSGTVNDQEGWVQNLNPAILQNAQTQAQTALQTYIQNSLTNPTVGDVIGGRKIIQQTATVLPTGLPYRAAAIGARYGALPGALQHTMTFGFGVDLLNEPLNPVTFSWSRLNNRKVTLSFKPATAADEQALAALLPQGPITYPNQLPSSIPAYLISVIPELAVDGQVVGQGSAMRLGEDLIFYYGLNRVNGQGSHSYTYPVIAGSYLGVAVAGGSVSPLKLTDLKTKLTNTQAKLQSGDAALIGTLTREDILGDMFQAGIMGYFGQFAALAHLASQPQKSRNNLPYGYGSFGYEPNVDTFFGIPRAITPGGIAVNVRLGWVMESRDGDTTQRVGLNLQTGMLSSALEHAVPEQMFSTATQPAQGVSAVKALQIASAQGQRIYHITPQNQALALPNLHLDPLAMSEITQALATGKEVIVHTDRISVPGWTGEGYIILDPATGAGAYKITGGGNGGWYTLVGIAGALILSLLTPIMLAVPIYLIFMLAAVTLLAIALALSEGYDLKAYWSSIEYMTIVFTGTQILVGLAKIVTLFGSAGFVPWLLAILTIYIITFGILKLGGSSARYDQLLGWA